MPQQDILYVIQELSKKLLSEYDEPHLATQSAWQLLELVTGYSQGHLFAIASINMTTEMQKKLDQWTHEITYNHKPIQYIIGWVPFLDLKIKVEPPVLIPRPETEEWVGKLIENISKTDSGAHFSILDLCTGSGCIALALAKAFPHAYVYATDISEQALQLAEKNAKNNHIYNIYFLKSDLYQNIPKNLAFDLIVANPPYIAESMYQTLDLSVTKWEDNNALFAAKNGLEIIEKIIKGAKKFLNTYKKNVSELWLEIDFNQAESVTKIFEKAGFKAIALKDLEHHNRVIIGTLS